MSADQICVQEADFDVADAYNKIRERSHNSGAIVLFTGLVRDFNEDGGIEGLILEHYPAMTEKSLKGIVEKARQRWPILATTIIHRVGKLHNSDQIVMVAVSSQHRAAAFEAAQFIMDYLKTEAPFWKKECLNGSDEKWVEAKDTDQRARDRW